MIGEIFTYISMNAWQGYALTTVSWSEVYRSLRSPVAIVELSSQTHSHFTG